MIRTSNFHFMRRGPQPIELPFEDKELIILKLQTWTKTQLNLQKQPFIRQLDLVYNIRLLHMVVNKN